MGQDAHGEDPERQSDRDQVDPTTDAERRQDEADEGDHVEDERDHFLSRSLTEMRPALYRW